METKRYLLRIRGTGGGVVPQLRVRKYATPAFACLHAAKWLSTARANENLGTKYDRWEVCEYNGPAKRTPVLFAGGPDA